MLENNAVLFDDIRIEEYDTIGSPLVVVVAGLNFLAATDWKQRREVADCLPGFPSTDQTSRLLRLFRR